MKGLVCHGVHERTRLREATLARIHDPLQPLAQRFPELQPPFLWGRGRRQALAHQLSPRAGYDEALALDQLLLGRRQRVLGEAFLPDWQWELDRLALWQSPRNNLGMVVRLLSKGLPQRCQCRQFDGLVRQLLKKDTLERQGFLRLVACTLLGNYRHARQRPVSWRFRRAVYDELGPRPQGWLIGWLQKCPLLLAFAIREFLCFHFVTTPPLRRQLAHLFDVVALGQLVFGGLDTLRAQLRSTELEQVESLVRPHLTCLFEAHMKFCYERDRPSFLYEVMTSQLNCALPAVSPNTSRALLDLVTRLPVTAPDTEVVEVLLAALPALGGSEATRQELQQLQHRYDYLRDGKRFFRRTLHQLAAKTPLTLAVLRLAAQYWALHSQTQWSRFPEHWASVQAVGLAQWYKPQGPPFLVPQELASIFFCPVCHTIYSSVRRPVNRLKNTYKFGLAEPRVNLHADHLEAYCISNKRLGHLQCGEVPLVQLPLLGAGLLYRRETYFLCPDCGSVASFCARRCRYTEAGTYLCAGCTAQRVSEELWTQLETALGLSLRKETVTLRCAICPQKTLRLDQEALRHLNTALREAGTPDPERRRQLEHQWRPQNWNQLGGLHVYPTGLLLCERHHHPDLASEVRRSVSALDSPAEVLHVIRDWTQRRRSYMKHIYRNADRAHRNRDRQAQRSQHA